MLRNALHPLAALLTDLESYLIASRDIVLDMLAAGDDLGIPREVEHYVDFDTASQKERFVEAASKIGFSYKGDVDSKQLEHGVAVSMHHSLDQDTLKEHITALLDIIKPLHGRYALWSAPLATKAMQDG